jgi:glutamate-1-semialdehyde 2,1-aminomutase
MIIAFIQARMGSVRLPNKVMKIVNGKPLIEYLLLRVAKAKLIDKVVVATSVNINNDPLVSFVNSLGFETYRGSERDVLSRFYEAAKFHNATSVLRITADCPLVDPVLIDSLISEYYNSGTDYATNTLPPTYPDGLDLEVFSFQSLERAYQEAIAPNEREHVTPYIRNSGIFKIHNIVNKIDYSDRRWTVDEINDFEVVSNIFQYFHPDIFFDWNSIIEIENLRPEMFQINKHIRRNDGAGLSDDQKLQIRDAIITGISKKC